MTGRPRNECHPQPQCPERVALKAADLQLPKKNTMMTMAQPSPCCFTPGLKPTVRACSTASSALVKQPIGSFFTCLVMAVALSLPMGPSLLLNNVERLGGSWQRAAQISLYLQMDASSEQGENLSDQIKGMAGWLTQNLSAAKSP